jgi:hypothetical protein
VPKKKAIVIFLIVTELKKKKKKLNQNPKPTIKTQLLQATSEA